MLLFLDIDGVMVPAKSWKSPHLLSDGFSEFSSQAVQVLQDIVDENTSVLLTTSHKSSYSISEWKNIFLKRGIFIQKLDVLNENKLGLSRKEEIENWFKSNSVNQPFLIIDDDKSLNGLPKSLKQNLVQTSSMIGLTIGHLEEIRFKLRMLS